MTDMGRCTHPRCECMHGPEDCGFRQMEDVVRADYVTDPHHGGKVTCHKCNGFILEGEYEYLEDNSGPGTYQTFFHKDCFNRYEHYYGLDKPID